MVEQSLSVDNLFVFVLLFDYFKVPAAYQMRVLNWGIIGAVIFRGIFVGLGAATLAQYERAISRARARPLPRTVNTRARPLHHVSFQRNDSAATAGADPWLLAARSGGHPPLLPVVPGVSRERRTSPSAWTRSDRVTMARRWLNDGSSIETQPNVDRTSIESES